MRDERVNERRGCEQLPTVLAAERVDRRNRLTAREERGLDAPAVRGARLLRLSDAEGAFRGWESDPTQALVFNTIERFFLLGGDWCCSSRVANEGRLYPVDPPPLVAPR